MTLPEFVAKWIGKRTDYDRVYAYQCVDLILQYLAEVYGITSGVSGNAIDYWRNPSARLLVDFEKVSGVILAGDIVVLNPTPYNQYGHIMIALDGVTGFEQNGATGDGDGMGGDEIRYRTIPKERVAGQLRYKGVIMDEIKKLKEIATMREDWLNKIAFAAGVDPNANPIEGDDVAQIISNIDSKNKLIASLQADVKVLPKGKYQVL